MKRSEIIQKLLDAYIFQEGLRANIKIIDKSKNIIKAFQKEETLKGEL